MILRRLTQSLKAQHWMAIAIEFVLLVSGVFLGIQVANWNEAQHEHQREAEYIARLTRDFEKIDERLADNIERWQMKSAAQLRVLDDVRAFRQLGRWPRPKEAMLGDMDYIFDGRIPVPQAPTYVELLSAGQLGVIRETKLREALLDYDSQAGYAQTAYTVLIQRMDPHMNTLVSHLQYSGKADKDPSALDAKGTPDWVDLDLQGLGTDPKVVLALNMFPNASASQFNLAKKQQEKARAVLAILKPDPTRDRQP